MEGSSSSDDVSTLEYRDGDSIEIDASIDTTITVEGQTLDSPVFESKNYGSRPADPLASREINGTEEQLTAQAAAGEDEIVLVTTEDYMNAHGDKLDDVESNVRNRLEQNGLDSDVTIVVTTYEELDS